MIQFRTEPVGISTSNPRRDKYWGPWAVTDATSSRGSVLIEYDAVQNTTEGFSGSHRCRCYLLIGGGDGLLLPAALALFSKPASAAFSSTNRETFRLGALEWSFWRTDRLEETFANQRLSPPHTDHSRQCRLS